MNYYEAGHCNGWWSIFFKYLTFLKLFIHRKRDSGGDGEREPAQTQYYDMGYNC